MKLEDFNYKFPDELIAKEHASPRDHSRLLVLNKNTGKICHDFFYNLPKYLQPGDLLVINNSKVYPARIFGKKATTGGKVEILLNKKNQDGTWEVIGKNLKKGLQLTFEKSILEAVVVNKKDQVCEIKFNLTGESFFKEIDRIGCVPLPPYIKKTITEKDSKDYQTVYAKERGSVAAPTAGLHFTTELIDKLKLNLVEFAEVTLHVGLGTFAPVEEEDVTSHKIHTEFFSVSKENISKILQARRENRRIVAVGTTSTRVLEHIFTTENNKVSEKDYFGSTDIFIYPGYTFKCVNALITNFHLPKSSLLILASAFAGREKILTSYKEAISKKYRFYSYGDGMLIF